MVGMWFTWVGMRRAATRHGVRGLRQGDRTCNAVRSATVLPNIFSAQSLHAPCEYFCSCRPRTDSQPRREQARLWCSMRGAGSVQCPAGWSNHLQ